MCSSTDTRATVRPDGFESRSLPTLTRLYVDNSHCLCSRQLPLAALPPRSEEHTSELQSQLQLVCRLLLESSADHPHLHSFPTRRSSDLFPLPISALAAR